MTTPAPPRPRGPQTPPSPPRTLTSPANMESLVPFMSMHVSSFASGLVSSSCPYGGQRTEEEQNEEQAQEQEQNTKQLSKKEQNTKKHEQEHKTKQPP